MTRTSTRSESLDRLGARTIYRIGSTAIYKRVFRYWYPMMTRRLGVGDDLIFLNWGYESDPPMGLELSEDDEPNRYSIQLYHQTATQAGPDLAGKKVLECSCGHGGGASYITRNLKPESYTGLDFNAEGVEFCRTRHQLPGLDFVHGDAENLPFPDESFDAVINVEASHIYPHFEQFLSEVKRVLRPGGHLLYADFRNRDGFGEWEKAIADSGLRLVSEEVINEPVLRGLKLNTPRHNDLINRRLPAYLRKFGREFAVVDGSWFYNDLERGEIDYRKYCLVKD